MSNYRKSFNFKSGVQVDNDNFVITPAGLVGIGTTVPTQHLDVQGIVKVSELTETNTLYASGVSTVGGNFNVGTSITCFSETGIISATQFRGDGSLLDGVIAIATDGWVVNTGTLSTTNNVLITASDVENNKETTEADFEVVGLSSLSHLKIGISTANTLGVTGLSTTKDFAATGVSTIGTLGVTGLSTTKDFAVTGVSTIATLGVTGIATTKDLEVTGVSTIGTLAVTGVATAKEIDVTGIVTASRLVSDVADGTAPLTVTSTSVVTNLNADKLDGQDGSYYQNATNINNGTISDAYLPDLVTSNIEIYSGISTFNKISSVSKVGIGTTEFDADFQIKKAENVLLEVLSTTGSATIGIGSTANGGSSSTVIKYAPLSQSLTIDNKGSGGIEIKTHGGDDEKVGVQTGGITFKYKDDTILNASYDGKVSINKSSVSEGYNLDVDGPANFNGKITASGGDFSTGIVTAGTIEVNNAFSFGEAQNFNTLTGISTFNDMDVQGNLSVGINLSVSGITTLKSSTVFGEKILFGASGNLIETTINEDVSVGANQIRVADATGIVAGMEIISDVDMFQVSGVFVDESYTPGTGQRYIPLTNTTINDTAVLAGTSVTFGSASSTIDGSITVHGSSSIDGDSKISNGALYLSASGTADELQDPRNQTTLFEHIADDTKYISTLGYGEVQIQSTSMSYIGDEICIVPGIAKSTTGSWDGLTAQEQIGMGISLGGQYDEISEVTGGPKRYLSSVGINTYFPRGLLDVGTASTTMNSYMILPSLTQDEINIVGNLWKPTSVGLGTVKARQVTPNGVPKGAVVYNTTTDQVQVRNTADSFKNVNPFIACGRVHVNYPGNSNTSSLTNMSYVSSTNPQLTEIFTFTNAVSGGYFVLVTNMIATPYPDQTANYVHFKYSVGSQSENGFTVTLDPAPTQDYQYDILVIQTS